MTVTNNLSNGKSSILRTSRVLMRETAPSRNKQINVKSLSLSDLESLKKNDPFMYYSIPSARDAALFLEEVDISKIDQPRRKRRKCCSQYPAKDTTKTTQIDDKTSPSQPIVERRTCISF